MKLYEITIRPTAGIGTPFKGDTIFGHFCWQASHDGSLLRSSLGDLIRTYSDRPFIVFSSAFVRLHDETEKFVFRRPDLPPCSLIKSGDLDRVSMARASKDLKRKKWILVGKDLRVSVDTAKLLDDDELSLRMQESSPSKERRRMAQFADVGFGIRQSRAHNSINRVTWTTSSGAFAPYTQNLTHYPPGTNLTVFVLISEEATSIGSVETALCRIGQTGFGRDASTGLGRFEVDQASELPLPKVSEANACYCLSPCVPIPESFSHAFFTPFIRFGKHGGELARSSNPFKNPVIMADEGAVFVPRDRSVLERPYFGSAVPGVSRIQPSAVAQGYAVYLPMKLEMNNV